LRSRLKALDTRAQLDISHICIERGIVTKLAQMTTTDYDRVIGLVGLYEMGEPVTEEGAQDHESRPARRPMP
jgi:hypothetical protein